MAITSGTVSFLQWAEHGIQLLRREHSRNLPGTKETVYYFKNCWLYDLIFFQVQGNWQALYSRHFNHLLQVHQKLLCLIIATYFRRENIYAQHITC